MPYDFVKILGVIFDDRLNLEKHINRVVSRPTGTCNANLRNLDSIASKLFKTLKVHLVYSLILSHIDHCNALFYNLPEYLLHKLTKVLYAAVRFILKQVEKFRYLEVAFTSDGRQDEELDTRIGKASAVMQLCTIRLS